MLDDKPPQHGVACREQNRCMQHHAGVPYRPACCLATDITFSTVHGKPRHTADGSSTAAGKFRVASCKLSPHAPAV
jgi:hypothetical protein